MEPTESSSAREDSATRFLRLCLQAQRRPSALAAAAQLCGPDGVDWNEVARLAGAERLSPLLFHVLQNTGLVPAELLNAWHSAYSLVARRNLLALFNLARVLSALRERRIEALVLKGAALIPTVYMKLGLRPLRDLDVLIHAADLEPALACLQALGYVPPGLQPQAGGQAAYESQVRLVRRAEVESVVEIHWSLFDSPYYQARLGMDWFWQSALTVELGGAPARVPGPGAHLLYLAGHLWLHHHGAGLLWWNDMAELIVHSPHAIAWPQLLRWTQDFDLVLPMQHVLAGLARDWAAPIPGEVLRDAARLKPKPAERRIFTGLAGAGRPAGPRLWLDVISLPGWRQRLHFAWSNLVPSAVYMRQRYGIAAPILIPFYYPYRWLRGIRSALERH